MRCLPSDWGTGWSNIFDVVISLYEKTTRYYEPIRRLGISFGNLTYECCRTLSLFDDFDKWLP